MVGANCLGLGGPLPYATPFTTTTHVLAPQGNYEEAKTLLERSLAIQEKLLGADHPDVASGSQQLGGVVVQSGDSQSLGSVEC